MLPPEQPARRFKKQIPWYTDMNLNENDIQNGLFLLCNLEGHIEKVRFDDMGLTEDLPLPVPFSSIIDPESLAKAADFWDDLLDTDIVFDYELYVKSRKEQEPQPLHFSGVAVEGQVWVLAAMQDEELDEVLDEMMLINNEQQNIIRRAEKKLSKIGLQPDLSLDTWDEISKVNNELVNAQRQLVKQNQQIKNLNNQLQRSNRELEHFAYAASHDLKEPLRMIRMFMQLLEKKYSDALDDKAREYIYYAMDGAERMSTMVGDLLEYSRIGRKNTEFEEVDLNKTVHTVIKLNQAMIEKYEVTVSYTDLPVISGQSVPLQQLFNNLIVNAIKYRKEGVAPSIKIAATEKPDEWRFSVSDNGRGIAPEHHQEIFNLFHRIEGQKGDESTGMGLATCKKIVEQHDGQIWVESEEGEGSTFYFTIAKD
ncbi:MAG: ATP-binding protein [Balneolaceae bacterium]|nr:ATP-binding protein [Balneolaceae bacterium]